MTALLAIELSGSNLDAMVGPISANSANTPGSTMNLHAGDLVSLRDLLYGLMLPSGNDAAIAIAEWISGSEPAFVTLMNQRAKQLGLNNTSYRRAAGFDVTECTDCCSPSDSNLPNCGHYTTARDLATLARFALNQPLFAQVVRTAAWTPTTWVDSFGDPRTDTLQNDNLLLSSMPYPGIKGVKTGMTTTAGWCLVASATSNGKTLISVVLASQSDILRHEESALLLDYGFAHSLGAGSFTNGSFESNYAGWSVTGNQDIVSSPNTEVTDGAQGVLFNGGQTTPNAALAQSFATVAGRGYALTFDLGVTGAQTFAEQQLHVTVLGKSVLLSQTRSIFGQGDATSYSPVSFTFTADSTTTTLAFQDVSPTTTDTDMLLDNVRISETAISSAKPPSIKTEPVSKTVRAGRSAKFKVKAKGSPVLHYQWSKNGANIPGATNASYTLVADSAETGSRFSVVVTNDAGSVTSRAATLTVR
jgi:D-alanyl-D-alanine carboxypeptidase